MQQGDCFVNKSAPGLPSHLWIILSDPSINPDDVLIVNYTDANNISDDGCELDAADHPGVITKRTRVYYQAAKVTSLSKLQEADAAGLLIHETPVPPGTLGAILTGASESDELKNAHRLLLQRQGFID